MDEGDRPTDTDGSAGRDERAEDRSAAASDGSDDESPDSEHQVDPGDVAESSGEADEADEANGAGDSGHSDEADDSDESAPGDEAESTPESRGAPEFEAREATTVDSRSAPGERHPDVDDRRPGVERADDGEGGPASAGPPETETDESLLYRFRHDREGALMWIREMLASVGVVLLVGLLLFGVSGVWPPMVAVESGSMEPNMQVGDLVFVTEPGQFAPDAAENGVGVVTHEVGQEVDYRTFGSYGSVMIYTPPGRTGSPIIHRAMFHVSEGENWYDRADEEYHNAVDCESLANCPAPHDGYVTLGDNNEAYDQASGLSPPVRAEWVNGVARVRVPYLGYIRLIATGQVELNEAIRGAVGSGLPSASSVIGAPSVAA